MRVGTARQWLAAGLSRAQLRTQVRRGALVRVRTGVYATVGFVARASSDPSWAEASRVSAALLALSGTGAGAAVASHRSAALILGLDLLNAPLTNIVTISRPPGGNRGGGRGIKLYSSPVPKSQMAEHLGVPVTSPARTVIDVARTFSFIEGVVVADSALRLRKTTKAELSDVLSSCRRWPGAARARQVIDFSRGRSESVLESCARVVFDQRGLEPPELQVSMETEGGIFRVDFYWREYRTIAEADGRAKYETPGRARDQLIRDQLLRDTGRTVIHFTWRDLFHDEDRLIRRLSAAFSTRPG